ncbi:TPA: hypothetical protein MNE07_003364 [Klebsiella pneumoniae]|nr:hypothetical protein [Klebsiella pneumoniae]HBQ0970597.1 hypothetical protein [Klebsiella pneumoniae]HBQ1279854.1 hypothetical protein [Klebsiella pneumoniae]HBU7098113.1 hypothetical protein [Klebsiella pneumoniae]HBU8816355.1 hypothetical protein [Klebsiella pneumoniae]
MNNETVNELITSLESGGELSIREQKFLRLAKAFKQVAAENVALKSKGKELLGEACAVYSRLNKLIDPSLGDFVDGQTLHEFQFVLDSETPATDRIVAGIKADGAKAAGDYLKLEAQHMPVVERLMMQDAAEICYGTAARLREGADK